MDYKADGVATCDGCGGLTNNRCSRSGMIVCDVCKEGNPLTRPNPVPRFIHEELEKALSAIGGEKEKT